MAAIFPRTPQEVTQLTAEHEPELAAMLRSIREMRYSATADTFEQMLLTLVGRALCAGGKMVLDARQKERPAA